MSVENVSGSRRSDPERKENRGSNIPDGQPPDMEMYYTLLGEASDQNTVDSSNELCKEIREEKLEERPPVMEEGVPSKVIVQEAFENACGLAAQLPKLERISALKDFMVHLEKEVDELQQPLRPLPKKLKPDELYQKRTDPFEHLERVYGDWLQRCNPENIDRDHVYQDDLRRLNPIFMRALENKIARLNNAKVADKETLDIRDYIKPSSDRNTAEINDLPPLAREKFDRLAVTHARRKYDKAPT